MKTIIIVIMGILGSLLAINAKTIKNIFGNKEEIRKANSKSNYMGSFYDYKIKSIDGKEVDFNLYKGKKVILINVASKCGYTPQYKDWQSFHEKFGDKIVVLGFPANDFLAQEPGSNEEIATFCEKNYGVTFQIFEKLVVTGSNQHPLFKWLSTKSLNGWNDQSPTWNFCKYIINEEGKLTHFFASKITPENQEFRTAVGI
jgi:glutathione peroxidase